VRGASLVSILRDTEGEREKRRRSTMPTPTNKKQLNSNLNLDDATGKKPGKKNSSGQTSPSPAPPTSSAAPCSPGRWVGRPRPCW
jgi:hypothetical protein